MEFKDIRKDYLSFEDSRNIIYNHDLYKKDLSLGMTMSWPVLRKNMDEIKYAFFFYPNMPSPSAPKDSVSRPSSWIIMNGRSGVINLFTDCRIYDFADTDMFPFANRVEGMKKIGIKEYKLEQSKLAETFDLLRLFAFKDREELNEAQLKIIADYKDIFQKITPTGHIPFYKALGKDYFEWLGL